MLSEKVKAGVKWTTVSTIVVTAVNVLKISILARYLDKSDFGILAILTFILGFVELFNDLGITSAVLHKSTITKNEYASLYWVNILSSVVVFIVVYSVAPWCANFYDQPILMDAIPILGTCLVLTGIGRLHKTIEQKKLQFRNISIIEIFASLLSLTSAVYLIYKDFGVYAFIYSTVVQYLLMNILFLINNWREKIIRMHFNYAEIKTFLNIGMYQMGGQVANYFNRDLDVLIIGKMLGADALGGYSLAKQLVTRPSQVVNPIILRVATPALVKFQDSADELKKNFMRLLKMVTTINFPIYLAIFIFAPLLVKVFYGNNFAEIVILVRILSVFMFIRAVTSPVGALVVATGKTKLEFIWNIFSLAVMPLFVAVGSYYGIVSSAVSVSVCMFFLLFPFWKLLISRLVKIDFVSYCRCIFIPDLSIIRKLLSGKISF